jgi:hypothetical protein
MPRKHKPVPNEEKMREQFMADVAELWDEHFKKFFAVVDDSESKTVNVTFRGTIDLSESAAQLDTTIAFSEVFKDKRSHTFEDPNQEQLAIEDEADEDGKKGRRGKMAAAGKDD